MSSPLRILVLTPWVPYPVTGACQQDRFTGLRHMRDMGFDLRVIGRIHGWQDRAETERVFSRERIPLTLVPHLSRPLPVLLKLLPKVIASPSLLDGAALEYADPAYQKVVLQAVEEFQPDAVWMEYTSHWPVLRLLKGRGIPLLMKSSLIEPLQSIDDNGRTLLSYLKAIPKFGGEYAAARESDVLLALTPEEEAWYRKAGARKTVLLPLRGLAECFERRRHAEKPVTDVVYLSSNYNMGHNREAAEFLLKKVIPAVRAAAPGRFRFHLTGKKFPDSLRGFLANDVIATGFVPDLGAFLRTMDVAVCPWVSGHGMQQKVFEPLCRSIPLVTNRLAGYAFEDRKEYYRAETAEQYVAALLELASARRRQAVADAAYARAETLFSAPVVQRTVRETIQTAVRAAPASV